MRKRAYSRNTLSILIFLTIFSLSFFHAPSQAAAPKSGAPCSKAGVTSTSAGYKYTCIKSGKKLIWNSGVKISTTSPTQQQPFQPQQPKPGEACTTEGVIQALGSGYIKCSKGIWEPYISTDPTSTTSASSSNISTVWSYLSVLVSGNGLGNIADASLVQLTNGNIRMYFKNGNDPQAGIAGFDNFIHSALSTDGGATWTVESGVRIAVQSPVEVLPKTGGGFSAWGWTQTSGKEVMYYGESSDGLTFTQVAIAGLDPNTCKTTSGEVIAPLGDPAVVKLSDGTWLLHAQGFGVGNTGPSFARWACVATSPDGKTWTAVQSRSYGGTVDVTTNPTIYINKSNKVEWIWPTYTSLIVKTGDGTTYGKASNYVQAGDPERLDLADGTELLALGGFDNRAGGSIIIAKKVTHSYKISKDTSLRSGPLPPSSKIIWTVTGASESQINVVNLCLNKNVKDISGAIVTIVKSGSSLIVTAEDPANSHGCVYVQVGPEKILR